MNRSQRRHMLKRSPHLRGAIKKSSKRMFEDFERALEKKWKEQQEGNKYGNKDDEDYPQ